MGGINQEKMVVYHCYTHITLLNVCFGMYVVWHVYLSRGVEAQLNLDARIWYGYIYIH